MPNRLIKESICTSDNLDALTAFQETFFYRLIVNCDDYGRMDARPQILASKLFPLKKGIRLNQISEALQALTSAELVSLYTVNGKPFLQMNTWDQHQRIRAKMSKFPAPDSACEHMTATRGHLTADCGHMTADDSGCQQVADICGRNPIQSNTESNPNPNPNPTRARAGDTASEESFSVFWDLYPKKVAKQDAMKAWKKLKPDHDLITAITVGLAKWKASDEWKRNDGQFIPHPATWLNGRRWEDEVPKASSTSVAVKPAKHVIAQQYTQRDYGDEDEEAWQRSLKMYGEL